MLGRVVETDPRQLAALLRSTVLRQRCPSGVSSSVFGRMMAKIGCGQALTKLDFDDFQPLVPPYIHGIESKISHGEGCKDEIEPLEEASSCRMSTLVSIVAHRG